MAKIKFENWIWEQAAIKKKHLHSNNVIFTADMFCQHCKDKAKLKVFMHRCSTSKCSHRTSKIDNHVDGKDIFNLGFFTLE